MTATRQISKLEQELAALGSLVDQYKEDFALPQTEADILVSSYQETLRLFSTKETDAARTYAQQCYGYYSTEPALGFFNEDETGRRIFTEVAAQYLKISEMVKA